MYVCYTVILTTREKIMNDAYACPTCTNTQPSKGSVFHPSPGKCPLETHVTRAEPGASDLGGLAAREANVPPAAGIKYDTGKTPWHLVPWGAVKAIADVLGLGAKKYAPNNWKLLSDPRERYFSAAMRHMIAWQGGENTDPESGHHHLAHVGCNVIFLLWFEQEDAKKGQDLF